MTKADRRRLDTKPPELEADARPVPRVDAGANETADKDRLRRLKADGLKVLESRFRHYWLGEAELATVLKMKKDTLHGHMKRIYLLLEVDNALSLYARYAKYFALN